LKKYKDRQLKKALQVSMALQKDCGRVQKNGSVWWWALERGGNLIRGGENAREISP